MVRAGQSADVTFYGKRATAVPLPRDGAAPGWTAPPPAPVTGPGRPTSSRPAP